MIAYNNKKTTPGQRGAGGVNMASENKAEIEIYTLDWCPYCDKAKNFLRSKGLSYTEYNIEDDKIKEEMKERTGGAKTVPQIFIDDENIGGYDDLIELNTKGELNQLLGIESEDNFEQEWEVTIIGAGPAALNAALYAARKGLEVLVIAADMGGQMLNTGEIDNYLGKHNVEGSNLIQSFWEHVSDYNVNLALGEEVVTINKPETDKSIIKTKSGKELTSKSVIIATGANKRKLGAPGEKEFNGKGVHYCATCDGYLYGGQPIAIVGGGNSGLEASLDLAKLGSKVDLIEVQPHLTGDQVLIDKVKANDLINVYTGTGLEEIKGSDKVEKILIKDMDSEEIEELSVDAVFIEIGLIPNSNFVEDLVELNEMKEIVIDDNNQTDIEGIWAAGDVTDIRDKQIVIAAAEGAKAALRVSEYLSE